MMHLACSDIVCMVNCLMLHIYGAFDYGSKYLVPKLSNNQLSMLQLACYDIVCMVSYNCQIQPLMLYCVQVLLAKLSDTATHAICIL